MKVSFKNFFSVVLSLVGLTISSSAQDPTLVTDINTIGTGTNPADILKVGAITFFTATDPVLGNELFITDGTSSGTKIFLDINPGSGSSNPTNFLAKGDTLFFSANDGINGSELWLSDGTTSGTHMVADIFPGLTGSTISNLTLMDGDTIYFSAQASSSNKELWRSDGTSAGTYLINNLASTGSSAPTQITNMGNGIAYFSAGNGNLLTPNTELYRTDGTSSGTYLIKDIFAGANSSNPTNITSMGSGIAVFKANDNSQNAELWITDGTSIGTMLVSDIRPGSQGSGPKNITLVGSRVFFSANDGTSGVELWVSNGTSTGTTMVADINPTPSSGSGITEIVDISTILPGYIAFTANNGTDGLELWKSDGSPANTTMIKNINALTTLGSTPSKLTVVGNMLYLVADNGITGAELWTSDATAIGTRLVKDINGQIFGSSLDQLTAVGNELYFTADDNLHGQELWKSDGGILNTKMVIDLNEGYTQSGVTPGTTEAGGFIYFVADDGISGKELWRTDGTTTNIVKDIYPGLLPSTPAPLVNFGDKIVFSATDGDNGVELWISDGTLEGTQMVYDINPGSSGSNVSQLTPAGDIFYFTANDGVEGSELWRSDGTSAGTFMVKAIATGTVNPSITSITHIGGGVVLFQATETGLNAGKNLWKSDGVFGGAGTIMVTDINVGSADGILDMVNVHGVAYFKASDGTANHGAELWKSDGFTTTLVADIKPGVGNSTPSSLYVVDKTIFFSANDGTTGIELWKHETDLNTTTLVYDINSSDNSSPTGFTYYSGNLFFSADDGSNGVELWKSDGTSNGTSMVYDINPGSIDSDPANIFAAEGKVYFSAFEGATGSELWETDGTSSGTKIVKDLNPGGNSTPSGLSAFDNYLFFSANDGVTGIELWKLQLPTTLTNSSVNGAQFCPNQSINIDYTISGVFNPGNIFTAELSNEVGDFSNPTAIGSYTGTDATTITATIPDGTLAGTAYRIRVTSSDPILISPDNGVDLVVSSIPSINITMDGSSTICMGNSITLTASSADSYLWSTGETTQSITHDTSGVYSVSATINGCFNTNNAEVTVVVVDLPTVVANSISVCSGSAITASDATSYLWSTGETSATINVVISGLYTNTITSVFGCESSDSIYVDILETPDLTITANSTICLGDSKDLTVSGANTYLWSENSVTSTINVSPTVTTLFSVVGTTGTCTDSAKVEVFVDPCTSINENSKNVLGTYPNPFSTSAIIKTKVSLKNANLYIYDSFGREMKIVSNVNSDQIKITRDNLSNGMYLYKIYEQSELVGSGKFMIQE